MVTPKASTKERDGVYACSWEKLKGKTPMCFTDGVQVVLSKCIRRTDQDWSYQTNFGGRIIARKRRAEALPAAPTDIPRESVMLKFRDDYAEAVMAKALEGGSDSETAPLEIPVDAMKRDGGERKPSGEETPNKKQKVLPTDEKVFLLHYLH